MLTSFTVQVDKNPAEIQNILTTSELSALLLLSLYFILKTIIFSFFFCFLLLFVRWIFPFIGHMGIGMSSGVIRDFAGPYYVSVGLNLTFKCLCKVWNFVYQYEIHRLLLLLLN